MITHLHYDLHKLPRIDTPDGRLYETPSGKRYPSVTTVTGLLGKEAIIAWRNRVGNEEANRISTKAAKRGTRVHSLCETYLNNEHVEPNLVDYETWVEILPELKKIDNVCALESPLYSDHLEVAGTVDCIAEYNGKKAVIDFKTSARMKSRDDIHGYFMQCSAYAVAFEERTGVSVPNLIIIMAVDGQQTLVFHEKRDEWIGKFIELRKTYKETYKI
jgi:genome maintenance exonuclease 1